MRLTLTSKILSLFVMLLLFTVASAQDDGSGTDPVPTPEPRPRFVDLDGDGFNDLAPDYDSDGIPNCMDPDFTGERQRIRWGHYRSMPDSARFDSTRFRDWWEGHSRRPVDWRTAWWHWRDRGDRWDDWYEDRWRGREGFSPRERRFLEEWRRRHRGGEDRGRGRGPGGGDDDRDDGNRRDRGNGGR